MKLQINNKLREKIEERLKIENECRAIIEECLIIDKDEKMKYVVEVCFRKVEEPLQKKEGKE